VKLISRIFLLLGIVVLMTGCKLAVIVVEGGEVRSTGSGTCVAGTICIVDVTDANFAETFTAVPEVGWYFDKWNPGDRFFCGGSTNPRSTLSFQGYEGSNEVADMLASSEVFYLMPVFTKDPGAIKVEGTSRTISVGGEKRVWLQPKEFIGFSFNQVSEVCPKGVCSGGLPQSTIDLTGYTWASSSDVRLLFNAYADAGTPILAEFEYTGMELGNPFLYAMLSDSTHVRLNIAAVFAGNENHPNEISDTGVEFPQEPDIRSTIFGPWFWHPVD
jgi:hypothetical protein